MRWQPSIVLATFSILCLGFAFRNDCTTSSQTYAICGRTASQPYRPAKKFHHPPEPWQSNLWFTRNQAPPAPGAVAAGGIHKLDTGIFDLFLSYSS
ncbi:hypothetical protein BO94DRAFT_120563 [Aspergillus sclerotioniger CBS 115572]|uniref:Secreted protein n=1 Tax=Aspergillus sclerotioniger CBS 115572 TaxID=1450535 RepID=A0A317WDA4_9EURO|nr:hypothetical protein BO94DRAFT_120563 [Aspergillus sclerotioniger CBS 115572]PWY83182.1 hypothetical protein BO94DRAFT_120563 [Aspergillus sclerotioniger CBS 115572]